MQSPITKNVPSMQIFYSGNIEGYLEPCGCKGKSGGGLARWATFIKENVSESQINLVLDSGYFVSYDEDIKKLKSEYILKVMSEIGYDAINLSEKDISQIGKKKLLNLNLPFVSSNIFHLESMELLTKPYIIKSFTTSNKEIKIGIFGLAQQINLEKEGLIIKEPINVAKEIVKELKNKCDIIIVITQLNKEKSLLLAKEVEGIEIIICDRFRSPKERLTKVDNTIILQPGYQGEYTTAIKLYLDDKEKIASFKEKYVSFDNTTPLNKEIVKIIDEYKKKIKEKALTEPISPFIQPIYVGTKKCSQCHQKQYKKWKKTRHAKAFYSLQKAKEDKNPECLKCHTTRFKQDNGFWNYETTPDFINVGCEECHGLQIHDMKVKTPSTNEEIRNNCTKCHTNDKDPEFNFEKHKKKIIPIS